ncbi:DUF4595 domain-containing protein [Larkinella rosea]|uniref:DUF4595 domain-containing protein n=1 Tax=Larkinella rosea TaxID=2025312 RepID=A0A3P1C145_9BACT|nr:DUF4595 domain-containing protein [Larkinella rosea]RRB06992.1 hypothetical protein EHT25_04200 [Larkinella rosea]
MKITYLLRATLFGLLAVGLVNCSDHQIPGSPTDKLRVKSITQVLSDNGGRISAAQKVSAFSYDGQGRLSGIVTSVSPANADAPSENSVFTYDGQNRLSQLKRVIKQQGGTPDPEETYTYTYTDAGKVAELNYVNNSSDDNNKWKVKFQYNPSNQLINSTRTFSLFPVSYQEELEYTYTGNNVTKIFTTTTLTRTPPGTPSVGTLTTDYTFDTSQNPFYGVFVIPAPFTVLSNPLSGIFRYYTYYGGIDNVFNLSENNVTSDGTRTYAYTYNAANLPLTRTTTEGGNVTETLQYEYENY